MLSMMHLDSDDPRRLIPFESLEAHQPEPDDDQTGAQDGLARQRVGRSA